MTRVTINQKLKYLIFLLIVAFLFFSLLKILKPKINYIITIPSAPYYEYYLINKYNYIALWEDNIILVNPDSKSIIATYQLQNAKLSEALQDEYLIFTSQDNNEKVILSLKSLEKVPDDKLGEINKSLKSIPFPHNNKLCKVKNKTVNFNFAYPINKGYALSYKVNDWIESHWEWTELVITLPDKKVKKLKLDSSVQCILIPKSSENKIYILEENKIGQIDY